MVRCYGSANWQRGLILPQWFVDDFLVHPKDFIGAVPPLSLLTPPQGEKSIKSGGGLLLELTKTVMQIQPVEIQTQSSGKFTTQSRSVA